MLGRSQAERSVLARTLLRRPRSNRSLLGRLARARALPARWVLTRLTPVLLTLGLLTPVLVSCQAHYRNYLRDYGTDGTHHRPKSAAEILSLVRAAARQDEKIRAIGSGHSSSDVARPEEDQAWIEVDRVELESSWKYYRPVSAGEAPNKRYFRVGAGTTIAAINQRLAKKNRALYNMGNYDGQTIAGAFSTGTHGSGLRHSLIADRVVAIELVTDEKDPATGRRVQRLLRLEPKDGVTDAEAFRRGRGASDAPGMVLEQNDAVFRAALINLGAFGVIFGVTLDTRRKFYLEESEQLSFWEQDELDLAEFAESNPEFMMVQLAPHAMMSDQNRGHVAYIRTERHEVIPCDESLGQRPRPSSAEGLGRWFGHLGGTANLELLALNKPEYAGEVVLGGFRRRAGRPRKYWSRSDIVHKNSLGPYVSAIATDIQVPLDRGNRAVNRIIELAQLLGTSEPLRQVPLEKQWWHTSPLGIRVVGQSRALLAPTYDGPRISIEIPLLVGYPFKPLGKAKQPKLSGEEYLRQGRIYRTRMLRTLNEELQGPEYRGRPHWGQVNFVDAEFAAREYGRNWGCWVAQYRRFNAYGTFDNSFTRRMCLSEGSVGCGGAPVHPPADACEDLEP